MALVALLPVALLVSASGASATSSFYWYGENDSTCWQTGQLGSSSSACDSVGAGYLAVGGGLKGGLAHMDEISEHGIGEDIELSSDGDYCNYYKVGDDITDQETNNQGGYTGYTTPTPYGSYQESDAHGDVCQADGADWGQEVRDEVKGNNCWETCGMHHFVSFHEQGLNDRPWAGSFGEPSLVVSAEADPGTFNPYGTKSVGAWGYVCPVLEDATTGDVLEYCLQEWRSKYNAAEWANERVASCSGGGGHNLDTLVSMFYPGTQYATEYSGSANTFVLESSGWRHYTAGITTSNLLNAINADKSACGRPLSTNPANYAFIGVEQGVEGWRELKVLAGSSRNLQLYTAYHPLPPEATTGEASSVTEEQASLNGTVNPKGTATHYYFQYGETTAYGSSTSEGYAGSGSSSVPGSATITSLEAGTTYHYRIVASNGGGTSYGSDRTFATMSKPAVYVNGTATQDAYFRGTNGAIWQWQWESSTHKWYPTELGGQTGGEQWRQAVGNPTAYVESASGEQDVYFRGTNGAIWQWQYEAANHKWYLTELGGQTGGEPWRQAAGNPTAYLDGSNQMVYFRGTNGAIWQWQYEASKNKWYLTELGGQAAGDPTAFVEHASGDQVVYFRGTNGAIWQWQWESSNHKWYLTELGGQTGGEPWRQAAGNPTAYVNSGSQDVYFRGTNGAIWQWQNEPSNHKWYLTELGGQTGGEPWRQATGTPTALVEGAGGDQDVYVRGTNGAIWQWQWESSKHKWYLTELGGQTGGEPWRQVAGSPTAYVDEGSQMVYFSGTNGGIWQWQNEASNHKWYLTEL